MSIKLFCIPHAGGTAASYLQWKIFLDKNIEIIPVELKGRGIRMNESFYENIQEAVDDIYLFIKKNINNSSYAIFGHSMGALLAFEVVHKIQSEKCPLPVHMFFSGRNPPHYRDEDVDFYLQSDQTLINEFIRIDKKQEKIFKDDNIKSIFLPIIRADYKILCLYDYMQKSDKINCDISILNGKDDLSINNDTMGDWKNYSSKRCELIFFDGSHFFVYENKKNTVNFLNETINVNSRVG